MRTCVSNRRLWVTAALTSAAVVALVGKAWTDEHPKPGPDEVFTLNTAIEVPHQVVTGGTPTFFSFDISWFDPKLNRYFLADRSNKSIDVVNPGNNSITQFVNPAYAGFTGNNDTSGPDGVLTTEDKQLWVGDSPGRLWVLDAKNPGTNLLGSGNFISVGSDTTTRTDEGCYDPKHHVVMFANPGEPKPFVTFISTTTHKVLSRLVFDGTTGSQPSTLPWPINGAGINATGGLEQCGWSPKTGKFYQNVPVKGAGPGGTIAVINPVSMTVEDLPVPNANCNLPQGMAIGPDGQIMEGCNGPEPATPPAVGPRNTVLMSDTGALLATYLDLGGADEVWFNPKDGHYFVPSCNTACRAGTGDEFMGVIDSSNKLEDQRIDLGGPIPAGSARRVHSVAADSHKNKVFLPVPASENVAGHLGPTLCSDAPHKVGSPTYLTGCIAVFTTKHDDHRPKEAHERGDDDNQE